MIESITITNVASFGPTPQIMNALAEINFLFGLNATGKTTISEIIATENPSVLPENGSGQFSHCSVKWKNDNKLQTLVYNRRFVERTFNQAVDPANPSKFKGIFTLGEENAEILNQIAELKKRVEEEQKSIDANSATEKRKSEEYRQDEASFTEECWKKKKEYETVFKPAFEGHIGSKPRFNQQILQQGGVVSSPVCTKEELLERSKTIFAESLLLEKPLETLENSVIVACESDSILGKIIVGRNDVDIAAMIRAC